MPARISDSRPPYASLSIVVITIRIPLIRDRTRVSGRCKYVDGFASERAIEVPDVDFAVITSRIDVATICGPWRGEMATDEGLEDTMASEGYKRTVVGVRYVVFGIVG